MKSFRTTGFLSNTHYSHPHPYPHPSLSFAMYSSVVCTQLSLPSVCRTLALETGAHQLQLFSKRKRIKIFCALGVVAGAG